VGESGGRGRPPARDRRGVRHPIERRVDLDGGEALDIVREHLRRRQLVRVEGAAPLRVVVPGGPDVGLQPSTVASGVGAWPIDSATPGCTALPRQTFTPLASAGFALAAAAAPRAASSIT